MLPIKPSATHKSSPFLTLSCIIQDYISTSAKSGKQNPTPTRPGTNSRPSSCLRRLKLREQQQATRGRLGFAANGADKENQTADALASLGAAQEADRQAFCQLVITNFDLADQLKVALGEITSIKNLMHNKSTNAKPKTRPQNNNYCWTHGFRVADDHTSKTCKNPKTDHQQTATKTNQMGGSTAGSPNSN